VVGGEVGGGAVVISSEPAPGIRDPQRAWTLEDIRPDTSQTHSKASPTLIYVSTPKKHHFVPQFLLRGFADEKGSLVVHGLNPATRYVSKIRDIGHENDGHALFRRDGTIDRESLEAAMGQIEGDAARLSVISTAAPN
jgi:hypothetical protein